MRFMNISNARKSLADLISAPDRTVLTREGEPAAVMVPIEDYSSLVAAHALLHDPRTFADALEDHQKVQAGDLSGTLRLELRDRNEDDRPDLAVAEID